MERNVVLVDMLDNAVGEMTKTQAHSTPTLHRAFSVFLYHGDKMLIQQRALSKYHCGGLWANTCCSHPGFGEDVCESAKKRLLEETGIVISHLEHLFEFTYHAQFKPDLYECEYDHVFLGEYQGGFSPDPSEVEQMRWVKIPWLLADMQANPLNYAPWFYICAPKVIEIIGMRF